MMIELFFLEKGCDMQQPDSKDFCYVCDNQAIIIFEQTDNNVADWEVLRTNVL